MSLNKEISASNNHIKFLQQLSDIDLDNNMSKLYICGSPPRMLNSNYFTRKRIRNINKFYIVYFLDDIVFHDKKDYELNLSSKINIKEHNWEKTLKIDGNNSFDNFFKSEINKIIYDARSWYDLCKKVIIWSKFTSKSNSSIEEWKNVFNVYSSKLIDFFFNIDNEKVHIDIVNCYKCGKNHIGPFNIKSGYCYLPCGEIYKDMLYKNFIIRLKKGYLQLVPAILDLGKVLIEESFYKRNFGLLKKYNIFDKFIVYKFNDGNFENIYISTKKLYLKKSTIDSNIIININKTENWELLDMYFGKNVLIKVLERHYARVGNDYKYADYLRDILKYKYNVVISDGKMDDYMVELY